MKILFVCSGNTCRSPMAEAMARAMAAERGLDDLEFGSAGTSAWDGAPASDGAMLVALERGLDLSNHRSRTLTQEVVAQQDLVLVMGPHHRDRAVSLGGDGRTFLLSDYASRGTVLRPVSDPFGGDLGTYRATADELEDEIRKVLERVTGERAGGRP